MDNENDYKLYIPSNVKTRLEFWKCFFITSSNKFNCI